jgi:predicted dehydrogenase
MKVIKAGFIGAGFVGPVHMENIRRLGFVEVNAVAEKNQKTAEEIAGRLRIPKAYGNWEDLVADKEIDVVHITAPNELHYPAAKAALEAGKHVICEKPLTLDLEESKILVELARKTGLVNSIGFNMIFYPMVRQAKEIINRGELGRLFLIHGRYLQDWLSRDSDYNWRVEAKYGGESRVVADIGSHWMHMVQTVSGKKIKSVFADMTTFYPVRKKPSVEIATQSESELKEGEYTEIEIDTEDHATIMFKFEDGVKGVLIAAQVCPGRKQYIEWEINGSEKSMSWRGQEPNVLWIGNRSAANEIFIKDANILDENVKKYASYPAGLAEGYPDSWKNILSAVYKHISNINAGIDTVPEYPTFEDGYKIQLLIDSVLQSAENNKWIDIP